jgi:SAM-dependent methyltransferase
MRNADRWEPTRFVPDGAGWRVSRDRNRVGVGSRHIARRFIRHVAPVLQRHCRGRLLDLGCGLVPYYGIYRDGVASCVCVDWPLTGHESAHLDVHADLNVALPLRDDAFDTVLLTDVIEHIARPAELVAEIARVLAPGGTLVLTTPFLYWLHEKPHDYFRLTEFALRRLCDDAGLEVVSLETYGGAADVVIDIVAKHLAFSGLLAATATGLLRALAFPFRGLARRTERNFPLGYCLVARASSRA